MTELEAIRERVAGHTPGPLRIEMAKTSIGRQIGVYVPIEQGAKYTGHNGLACIYDDDTSLNPRPSSEHKANAKLFAAAPDLLRIATEQAQRIEELETMARKAGEFALMDSRDRECLLSSELREYQSCAEECAALVVKESES